MTNLEKYQKMSLEELVIHITGTYRVGNICPIAYLEGDDYMSVDECNERQRKYCVHKLSDNADCICESTGEIDLCCRKCFKDWLNEEVET